MCAKVDPKKTVHSNHVIGEPLLPEWFIVHRFEPPIRVITSVAYTDRDVFQERIVADFSDLILENRALVIDGFNFEPEAFEGPEGMCMLWRNTGQKERLELENFIGKDAAVLESLLDNLNTEIVIFSTDHRYLYANAKSFKDASIRQWIIGRNDYDLCLRVGRSTTQADERRAYFNRCLETNAPVEWIERYEWKGQTQFRSRRLIPMHGDDGNVSFVLGFGYDVTEIQLLNEQLQANSDELKHLLESNMAGIFRSSLSGKFIELNEAFAQTFGYTREELINAPSVTIYRNPDDREAYKKRLIEERVLRNYEMHLQKKDGSEVYIMANISLDERPNEEPQIIGTLIDVTLLKRTSKELDLTVQELRQKSEDILKFSHIVSHHLRAPVVNAKNLLQLLKRASGDVEQCTDLANRIGFEVNMLDESMHELNNLLEGRSPDQAFYTDLSLSSFIKEVTDEFSNRNATRKLHFHVSGDDRLVIRTQAAILKNCLWTMFKQADERLPESGSDARISIGIHADANKCSITVTPYDKDGILSSAHGSILQSPGILPMINYLGGQIEVLGEEQTANACVLRLPLSL